MRVLEPKEIVDLLRAEVKKAGSQEAWAKKAGIDRSMVNKVIHQKRPLSHKMMKALGLRVVIVKD
jgi:plasmid maintenance system antidote protein VapI